MSSTSHGRYNQIPIFDQTDLYVYFNSLQTPANQTYGLARVKNALYRKAHTYLYNNTYNLINGSGSMETINNALGFLGNVADNERAKEIALIENYINEIYESIPEELRKSRTMQEILNNLKQTSKDISYGNKMDPTKIQGRLDNFYKELTSYINLVKQSYEEFEERIDQLMDDTMESREALTDRSFLYRVDGDIESALKESVGAAARKEIDSFSSMINETIMDYLAKGLIDNMDIQNNFHAILSGMIVDFEHFIQTNRNGRSLSGGKNGGFLRKDITKLFDRYLVESNTYFSKQMQQVSKTGTISKGFKMALNNFSSRIGLSTSIDSSDIEARDKALQKQANDMQKEAIHGQRNYIAKRLNELNLGNLVQNNKYIKITPKTDQRHGTMYEAINTILTGAFSTEGHPATDSVSIGSILLQIDDQGIEDEITAKVSEIAQEIRKTGQQDRRTRKDSYVKQLRAASKEIKAKGKEIKDKIAPLLEQEKKDLFIYHESLKLYSSMEQTDGSGEELKRKTNIFEGRNLNALNAVDLLYSMQAEDGMNTMGLIDQTALAGAMQNLSQYAIGGSQKASIESYLSIFTGLIMFSDLANMAEEIGNMAASAVSQNNNDATHIHLYSLNGTYVPGSLVLTYIYNIMSKLGQQADISSFAKANISTAGADKAIKNYQAARASGRSYDRNDWEEVAEEVQRGTKLKITFMGSFLTLVNNIGNIMNP